MTLAQGNERPRAPQQWGEPTKHLDGQASQARSCAQSRPSSAKVGPAARQLFGMRESRAVMVGGGPVLVPRHWSNPGPQASYSAAYVREIARTTDDEGPLLERLRQRFLAFARRSLASDVAEDLVQEAFLLLTTKYAHVREPEERVRLGITILRKKRAGHWRKSQRRGEAASVDAAETDLQDDRPDPEEQAERELLVARLRTAVATLSGRCRELVRLKLEERTFPEIAEIMQAKINTVYSWDHRCTERLRALVVKVEVRR